MDHVENKIISPYRLKKNTLNTEENKYCGCIYLLWDNYKESENTPCRSIFFFQIRKNTPAGVC